MIVCKYKNKCSHYQDTSYTCNIQLHKEYCGYYRSKKNSNKK
jgi:hypothetical protein